MKRILAAAVMATLIAGPAYAGTQHQKKAAPDKTFADDAARGGIAEVRMGELAQKNGASPEVKSFGETLVRDHTKANDDLKQVASNKGLSLPGEVNSEQKKHYDMLSKLQGAEFDRAFAKHMVDDHQKDIAKFEKEARSGKDGELKQFADSTLPTLREHLRIAQDIQNKTGGAVETEGAQRSSTGKRSTHHKHHKAG